MIRTILIDDEDHIRKILQHKITKCCTDLEIVGEANSAQKGYELIKELKPDLVFLDIAMPKETGFDLLKRFDSINFEIIFATGFDNFAINAIEFCAIGYLTKPINDDKLSQTIAQAKKRILQKKSNTQVTQLIHNLSNPGNQQNKICIPSMNDLEFVTISKIIRCEGVNKMTRIIIEGQKEIISSYNIGNYHKMLEPYGFFVTHKSHLVNLSFIKKYQKDGMIILEDGSTVPVAKRRRKEFLESLNHV